MPDPNTLKGLANADVAQFEADVTAATASRSLALGANRAARTLLQNRTASLAEARHELESLRPKLHDIPSDADGDPLLIRFRELVVEVRRLESRVAQAKHALRITAASSLRPTAELDAAHSHLEAAESRLDGAKQIEEELVRLADQIGTPEFGSLVGDANGILADQRFLDRQAFAGDGGIPAPLREAALRRRALEVARLENARALVAAIDDLERDRLRIPVDRTVAERTQEYERALAQLREFVASSLSNLARARQFLDRPIPTITGAQLQRLGEDEAERNPAGAAHNELMDAQALFEERRRDLKIANLQGTFHAGDEPLPDDSAPPDSDKPPDHSALPEGDPLSTPEELLDDAKNDREVMDARAQFEERRRDLEISDPQGNFQEGDEPAPDDGDPPEGGPPPPQELFDDAKNNRDAKLEAFEPQADTLAEWQAILPDEVWKFFGEFHETKETLEQLAAANANALTQAVEAADAQLVQALVDAAGYPRADADLAALAIERRARLTSLQTDHQERLAQAMRGEAFLIMNDEHELEPKDDGDV